MEPSNVFKSIGFILILFFSGLMLEIILPYFSLRPDVDFLLTKQNIIHIKFWRYSFYAHIFSSLIVLVFGAFQFSNYLIKNYKRIHRLMGKTYVIIVVLISGPGGLAMSFYANGNFTTKFSFVLLSVLWIFFTLYAFVLATKKNIIAHKAFMIRSYALTLSAITLRIYAYAIPYFLHMDAKLEYSIIAWCSWTLNLIVAEIIIYKGRNDFIY